MDLLAVTAVVREVAAALEGALLSRVVQTAPETLVLEWWAGGRGERRLVLSAEPEAPRVHLTALAASALRELPPPAGGPPRFAAYLRAHAKGARLLEARQSPAERVVVLRLGRAGEVEIAIVAELLGSHAQLLALDADGRVLEVLRRTGSGAGRRLVAGDPYTPPAPGIGRPLTELPRVAADLAAAGPLDAAALARAAVGLTPPLAAHLLAAAGGPPPEPGRFARAAEDLAARLETGRFEPRIYRRQGSPPILAMLALAQFEPAPEGRAPGVEVETFASPSAAVEAFYASPAERLARRATGLRTRLLKARKRLTRRLAALEQDRTNLERAADARRLADLMAAQRHLLGKGRREARLVDYFDPEGPPVTVALDPALDPQGNIDAYYARARKSRRGLETVAARQAETAGEAAYVDQALYALDAAEDAADIDALEAELAEQGLLGASEGGGRAPRPASRSGRAGGEAGRRGREGGAPALRRFRSSDGLEIVAGKTNVSNDYVSTRLASPDDLWLHAEGYPGAHVLVRRAGRETIPERTVLEAAAIAAFYSKARGAAKVAVHVAAAASVRKPRGARPGLVTLAGAHRSLVVAPDPELPARLAAPSGS